jgi:hypothetical protein
MSYRVEGGRTIGHSRVKREAANAKALEMRTAFLIIGRAADGQSAVRQHSGKETQYVPSFDPRRVQAHRRDARPLK